MTPAEIAGALALAKDTINTFRPPECNESQAAVMLATAVERLAAYVRELEELRHAWHECDEIHAERDKLAAEVKRLQDMIEIDRTEGDLTLQRAQNAEAERDRLAAEVDRLRAELDDARTLWTSERNKRRDAVAAQARAEARAERYAAALREIVAHDMSQRQPCDYHCTAKMVSIARAALAEDEVKT